MNNVTKETLIGLFRNYVAHKIEKTSRIFGVQTPGTGLLTVSDYDITHSNVLLSDHRDRTVHIQFQRMSVFSSRTEPDLRSLEYKLNISFPTIKFYSKVEDPKQKLGKE